MADENNDDALTALALLGIAGAWSVGQNLFGSKARAKKAFETGVSLAKKGYYDQSTQSFYQAIKLYPEFGAAHFELGKLFLHIYKNPEQAYNHSQAAVHYATTNSERASALLLLADGYVHFGNGAYDQAMHHYHEALNLLTHSDPFNMTNHILINLSYCYEMKQDFATAAQLINQVLSTDPQNLPAQQKANDLQNRLTREQLRQFLNSYFNLAELKGLCFELGIDYEALPEGSKDAKIIGLITYFERHHGSLNSLIQTVQRQRPGLA